MNRKDSMGHMIAHVVIQIGNQAGTKAEPSPNQRNICL